MRQTTAIVAHKPDDFWSNLPWPERYLRAGSPGRSLPERLAASNAATRYAFSLCCDLHENPQAWGRTPGGVRKQLTWDGPLGGEVSWSDGQQRPNLFTFAGVTDDSRVKWNGQPLRVLGTVGSGNDWAYVDGLGVGICNARVTLKLLVAEAEGFDPDRHQDFVLVDATFKGMFDLAGERVRREYADQQNPALVDHFRQKDRIFSLEEYLRGASGAGKVKVPVSLSARFEGPSGPMATDSDDEAWIPERERRRQRAYAEQLGALSRGQFFAAGHLLVDAGKPGWPAERIELHVFDVDLLKVPSADW